MGVREKYRFVSQMMGYRKCENLSKSITDVIKLTDYDRKSKYKIKIAGFKNKEAKIEILEKL